MLRQLLNQVTVHLRLETLEPVLVKSGGTVLSGPDMAFVRTNRNGRLQPYLPGSSLKGVIRSHAERIARTLKPRSVCDVFAEKQIATGRPVGCSSRQKHSKDYADQCPACRLFGSLIWKGRTRIGDAYLTPEFDGVEPELRDGIGIDRVTGGVAGGAKFDLEVVPSGVQFSTRLDITNFETWQLGWMAYVLRDLTEGHLSIGTGSSRGLGRILAHLDRIEIDYIGDVKDAQRLAGIGALLGPEEVRRYGLRADDFVEAPPFVRFQRPAGTLRSRVSLTDPDEQMAVLAAVAPAWDRFIPLQPDLPLNGVNQRN